MAEELPQEALVGVFHLLPIKDRSRLACVCKSWRLASLVDAVSVKLKDTHVPNYLHVALPDGAAQLQAAACPMMSLARSADLAWASAATGSLLQSMPSLERLAFTSMASGTVQLPAERAESGHGLHGLKSLTNLQSLQLNTCDAAPVLEAMPSAPRTLAALELHLTGDNWQSSVLDKIANQLGSQASHLRSLVLRCSHASVYAATEPMESLSRLTGLTSLRMGPNPEDIYPHSSPLGFGRLPAFLGSLSRLQRLDITMADAPAVTPLTSMSLRPLGRVPDVRLTLRADTSFRAVAHLPPSITAVVGLSSLTVQGFTFEDPGGWCTTAYFDATPLAACPKLRRLELQLGTWECEHCEAFELLNLQQLTQLRRLRVCIAASSASSTHASIGGGGGASSGGAGGSGSSGGGSSASSLAAAVPEALLMLPLSRPAVEEVLIASSMRLVLRNSKVLARARVPGVLAHSIALEEPLPQRPAGSTGATAATSPRAGGSTKATAAAVATPRSSRAVGAAAGADATRGAPDQQQQAAGTAAAAAAAAPPAVNEQQQQAVQQYVRAPAHVVISALRDLWPCVEVWQYPGQVPGLEAWRDAAPELCCKSDARDAMQQQLADMLLRTLGGPLQGAAAAAAAAATAAAAAAAAPPVAAGGGFGLW